MRYRCKSLSLLGVLFLLAAGCGNLPDSDGPNEDTRPAAGETGSYQSYYAAEVVSFTPGDNYGHGHGALPEVITGPPDGASGDGATLDVLALGVGGEVILRFADGVAITDGPGPDFVVFENPFLTDFEDDGVWEELGAVAVSSDGETWTEFDCNEAGVAARNNNKEGVTRRWPGCAGWRPTKPYDPTSMTPLDPAETGGDAFDLADIGVDTARYVRIRDLSEEAMFGGSSAGFDLDAVGIVNRK